MQLGTRLREIEPRRGPPGLRELCLLLILCQAGAVLPDDEGADPRLQAGAGAALPQAAGGRCMLGAATADPVVPCGLRLLRVPELSQTMLTYASVALLVFSVITRSSLSGCRCVKRACSGLNGDSFEGAGVICEDFGRDGNGDRIIVFGWKIQDCERVPVPSPRTVELLLKGMLRGPR